jgi:hypothetical protein
LEPEGDGWLLRYPLASVNLHEPQFGSFEATLPIVGETRNDALMIAELVLRGHEPPEISTQPATEPPPHAKLPCGAASIERAAKTAADPPT